MATCHKFLFYPTKITWNIMACVLLEVRITGIFGINPSFIKVVLKTKVSNIVTNSMVFNSISQRTCFSQNAAPYRPYNISFSVLFFSCSDFYASSYGKKRNDIQYYALAT